MKAMFYWGEGGLKKALSKKVAIATLGCKVNQYDSAQIEEILKKDNYQIVSDQEAADVYIVNSCTVTAKADQEARHLLRRFQKVNPKATLVLTGCYAQTQAQELSKFPSVHYVVGNTLKTKISELLKQPPKLYIQNAFHAHELSNIPIESFPGHTRVFLKIQDGCDDFCTFCIIPYARGKSRSLAPEAVISQIALLVKNGTQEVVLTGVSLGSYGWDLSPKTSLASLVQKIEKETSLLRLRISSLEPEDVNEELLSTLENSEKFCPHFHLPLQSGCNFILEKMKRNYTTHYYENLILKITRDFKDVFIGTDVISGFPGETKEHAQESFHFLENLPWSKLHVFPYSARKGTPATKFLGKLSRSEILERSQKLRELSDQRYQSTLDQHIGRSYLSLVEKSTHKDFQKALSRNYLPIYFKSSNASLLNTEIKLKVLSHTQDQLLGQMV